MWRKVKNEFIYVIKYINYSEGIIIPYSYWTALQLVVFDIITHNVGTADLILTQHSLFISCDLIKVMDIKHTV